MDTIPLLPDFQDLLKFFTEEKVEYLVVGGMAVNYHGYHRSTGDLDVWVAISPQNDDRLARALQRFGFSEQAMLHRPLLEKPKFLRIGQPRCVWKSTATSRAAILKNASSEPSTA